MKDIVVLTGSESLSTIVSTELSALGYSVGRIGEYDCRLLIADADSHTALGGIASVKYKKLLCISRLPETVAGKVKCDAVLKRPVSVSELRETALSLLKALENKSIVAPSNEKLSLDGEERSVRINSQRVRLSEKEFALFSLLFSRRGEAVSRDDLAVAIDSAGGNEVDVYICLLRKKLEANRKRIIFTIRGIGYKLI